MAQLRRTGESGYAMYKIMTLATLLVGLALAPVIGSLDFASPSSNGNADHRVDSAVAEPAEAPEQLEAEACSWTCEACAADQGCSQICTEIGECGSACGVKARCDEQFRWDENLCACVTR